MLRLRVCELITELRPAGAERAVYELATRLDRRRFDVQVVSLRGGKVADWLTRAGVDVTILGVRGKWDVPRLCRLTTVLRRRPADLLHTHLFHADLAGRPAGIAVAVPHLIHTVHTAEGRFRPWQYAYARFLSGYCDRIICPAPSVRDHHARRSGLPHSRYSVVSWGVDAKANARDSQSRRRLRRQWGIPQTEVLAAFVGRLSPEKGVETLLAAMSHLGARGDPIHLVIAGDGPQRQLVENFIAYGEGGSHARALGFVDDVRGVMSAADMLIMPSRWEGFALAAAEAMVASLPVIATKVTALVDLIDDERTGLLVDSGDVVALAEAIRRLAKDTELRARLGAAAHKEATEVYSIDKTVAAHEKLYLQVAGAAS